MTLAADTFASHAAPALPRMDYFIHQYGIARNLLTSGFASVSTRLPSIPSVAIGSGLGLIASAAVAALLEDASGVFHYSAIVAVVLGSALAVFGALGRLMTQTERYKVSGRDVAHDFEATKEALARKLIDDHHTIIDMKALHQAINGKHGAFTVETVWEYEGRLGWRVFLDKCLKDEPFIAGLKDKQLSNAITMLAERLEPRDTKNRTRLRAELERKCAAILMMRAPAPAAVI